MTSNEIARHRRTGSLRAQRALRAADVDYESPIDVFGAIEREQVWLLFQPLDRLFGAYRRYETPGIVVHAGHPYRVQRFTAAHELGHHLLGHEMSVDSQREVERTAGGLPAQEIEAQAFAATYLMPVQLVNRALSNLELPRQPRTVTPEQAYRLSLEVGSSYTATVTQLRALDRISATHARELLKRHPIDIKTELALGHRPANARADVWPLSKADDGRRLQISRDDEVHLRLVESPTTGYRWRPQDEEEQLELVGDEKLPVGASRDRIYGGKRLRHVWWRATAPADAAVRADLRRSFSPGDPAEQFQIQLEVLPRLTGESERGVSRRQLGLQ